MLVTDGEKAIAAAMGGEINIPTHIGIGTGSSTVVSGNTTLLTEIGSRNIITDFDTSAAKNITYITDFSATEMSGTTLYEWGLFNAAAAGSMFMREVIGSIIFEGDSELQIQATLRFARSGA